MGTRKKEIRPSIDYKEFLFRKLRDPKMAAGYLTASLEEGNEAFLLALRDVAEARGGIGPLAKEASLNREGLYDMLSEKGNPRLSSVSSILDALGLKVEFAVKSGRKSPGIRKGQKLLTHGGDGVTACSGRLGRSDTNYI